jgi:hypothetical protein
MVDGGPSRRRSAAGIARLLIVSGQWRIAVRRSPSLTGKCSLAYPGTGGWLSGSDRPLRWPTEGVLGRHLCSTWPRVEQSTGGMGAEARRKSPSALPGAGGPCWGAGEYARVRSRLTGSPGTAFHRQPKFAPPARLDAPSKAGPSRCPLTATLPSWVGLASSVNATPVRSRCRNKLAAFLRHVGAFNRPCQRGLLLQIQSAGFRADSERC